MKWFWRKKPHLPLSSGEIEEALRTASRLADDPTAAAEYMSAADALNRVTARTARHADQPTRDELQYALGRAELNLKDELQELIEIVKHDRMDFQGLQQEVGASIAAVRAMEGTFSDVGENVSQIHADLRRTVERVELLEGRQRREGDILQLHDQRIADLETYAASLPSEERQRVVATVGLIEQRYAEVQREREADRIWKEQVIEQLADVLARLPEKHAAGSGDAEQRR
jgi:hypothetical protein